MRVLVVDDSRTMRTIIRKALEGMRRPDTEIIEASDGAEALQIVRNDRLDLDVVLLDWSMPRLDGIGFLKALKVISPLRELSVIMVTSQSQRGQVAEALRWGAKDYVVKPFTEETLREKFSRLESQIESRKSAETSVMLQAMARSAATDERLPFLSQLPGELIEEMKSRGRRRRYDAGLTVAYPGQAVEGLAIVLSGEVELEDGSGQLQTAGEGHCFGEDSFIANAPINATVRARNGVEILTLPHALLGDLVRRYPRLSYALSALVARQSALRRSPEPASGFSGRLKAMPISDLLQVLHLCRKTGELRLRAPQRQASIFVEDGAIVDAVLGEHQGEEAVYDILGWLDASFEFQSGEKPDRKSVTQPTMMLLMEGARRADERRKAEPAPGR